MTAAPATSDVAVVGAGAAGLATAIFAARRQPELRIVALDGAPRLGAKILVSGGARCNVTNSLVTEADFHGGSRNTIRRVLRAFAVSPTVAFFREIGVPLHEEADGKLFPDTNRARTVLEALLREAERLGVGLRPGHRVRAIERHEDHFVVMTNQGRLQARRVVLATGGLSLPKTGSDGGGYALAQSLGHSLVPTTPALVPLILDGDFHRSLAGVSVEAEVSVATDDARPRRARGAMLFTHFGISGPAVLDSSRHWLRGRLSGQTVTVTARFGPPGAETLDKRLLALARERPRLSLRGALTTLLPVSLCGAILAELRLTGATSLSQLPRHDRRRLVRALDSWPLPVRDSRGYAFAEATAGGVPLNEIDPRTMESRRCSGLYLVGEILDVDGRIGGFNFQWAWSSGFVAGRALADASTRVS